MKKTISITLLLCLGMATATASELKIGFIDAGAAIAASGLYDKDINRIRGTEKKLSKHLVKLERQLLAASKTFKKKNAGWKAETIIAKQKDMADLEIRINRSRSDAQQLLKRENQRLDARAIQRLNKAVKAYGESHQYTVILLKGQGFLYDDGSIDISTEIGQTMKRMK